MIIGVKAHWIGEFFISLESSYNDPMGLHDPFGHLKHKLWPKEGSGVKLAIWLLTTKSWKSTRFPCVHIIEKLLTSAIILLKTSSQSEVCTQSYGAPKWQESQFWQFQDPHLGVLRQNVIWMWASWRGTKYIIMGKVVASPNSGP
jgi:hypothetical protein